MHYLKIIVCFLLFPLVANGKADADSIRLSMKYMEDGLRTKEMVVAQKSFFFRFLCSYLFVAFCVRLIETNIGQCYF